MSMNRIINIFLGRQDRKSDFSSFFRYASSEEKSKLLKRVAREANDDQKKLMEDYKKIREGAC